MVDFTAGRYLHTLPIGGEPLNSNAFLALTKAGSLIFLNGLMLATAHYSAADPESGIRFTESYGPAIIHFIGFPLTLTVGISLMAALMPFIGPFAKTFFS